MNFDLFRETFVQFDLDIDLFFTTQAAILVDQPVLSTSRCTSQNPKVVKMVISDESKQHEVHTRHSEFFMMFTSQPCCL